MWSRARFGLASPPMFPEDASALDAPARPLGCAVRSGSLQGLAAPHVHRRLRPGAAPVQDRAVAEERRPLRLLAARRPPPALQQPRARVKPYLLEDDALRGSLAEVEVVAERALRGEVGLSLRVRPLPAWRGEPPVEVLILGDDAGGAGDEAAAARELCATLEAERSDLARPSRLI